MTSNVGKFPENTSLVIPRLVCRDPAAEIDFCVRTFEAVVLNRRPGHDGSVAHALLTIGPEMIMIEAGLPRSTAGNFLCSVHSECASAISRPTTDRRSTPASRSSAVACN